MIKTLKTKSFEEREQNKDLQKSPKKFCKKTPKCCQKHHKRIPCGKFFVRTEKKKRFSYARVPDSQWAYVAHTHPQSN